MKYKGHKLPDGRLVIAPETAQVSPVVFVQYGTTKRNLFYAMVYYKGGQNKKFRINMEGDLMYPV